MLSDRDRAILDLESKVWRYQGAKEAVIRTELDLTPTRYYQVLRQLLQERDAAAYRPMVVNRLRRRLAPTRSLARQLG